MMLKSSIKSPSNLPSHKPSTQFIKQVLSDFAITCPDSINLSGYQGDLTNDSRSISNKKGTGDIFCAIIGHAQDGRQYSEKAIASGAKLVLSECENKAEHGHVRYCDGANEPVAIISFYQLNKKLFSLASAYYQSPEKSMTMIGITGTNGKTSTSQLLGQTLTNCQKPCAIIGTNGAGMVDDLQALENTTPSATDLMQLFSLFSQKKVSQKKASLTKNAEEKITHLAMEVSSHALEQGRVTGSIFDIAVFTNLSRDHLDYHGTMADYAAAKRQLFTDNDKQISVLNGDDAQAQRWLKKWPAAETLSLQRAWLYGRSELVRQHAQFVSCHDIKHHNQGVTFILNTHLGDIEIHSPLLGDFNIDNLLAVIAVLLIEGITLAMVAKQVTRVQAIAGRMEAFSPSSSLLSSHAQGPTAVVDYAHTPDALEKALIACRQHCHGNLFVVFGCGGDRDKGKRPLMAQAAQKYADYVVVTNDNPRTEPPMSIIDDVLAGFTDACQVSVIVDRKQAVLATLAKAQANDVVLFAGKGHEDYIILGHDKIDYNERQVVKNFFEHFKEQAIAGEQA
tara:strand:+ start:40845 stop:42536 length:1692 start_codon:yes stop_codon:yes gene_type:complete